MAAMGEGETAALVADASVDPALSPSNPTLAADPSRPAAGLHWTVLPPMATPRHDIKRSEATCGCSLVLVRTRRQPPVMI